MKFQGKAWKFGSDIDTDAIIPARYLNTADEKELAKHCMEDADTEFIEKISQGDIIVAEDNFGCGSSREHAPIAIKYAGISCVIAKSFARIFFRNSFNMGLPIFECPEAVDKIDEGDELYVDAKEGLIKNITKNITFKAQPIPDFMQTLINEGGLLNYVINQRKGSLNG
jgi:3-isopropylmalate/(R)-2-methylmalate dehydratase small subunit